jgi:hypothetical protein
MLVVELGFAAARILHDRETERQRDGETEIEGWDLIFSLSLCPSVFIAEIGGLAAFFCQE